MSDPNAGAAVALDHIIGSILTQLLAQVAAARAGETEGVHQLRVAVRRLRTALALFRPLLGRDAIAPLQNQLRGAGRVFGPARDWDVFVAETLRDARIDGIETGVIDALTAAAGPPRAAAHITLAAMLDGADFIALLQAIERFRAGVQLPEPLAEAAPALLRRMLRKARRRRHNPHHAGAAELHELRKATKKLRYAIEMLDPFCGDRNAYRLLKACRDLQDILGRVNDGAAIAPLVAQLHDPDGTLGPAIGTLTAWAERRARHARRRVTSRWHKLREADPFG